MKKLFLLLLLSISVQQNIISQTNGVRIAYIDMEYILENINNYKEANLQLEIKADKWKEEINIRTQEIEKLKNDLNAEKALLTKELIEDRELEIDFLEKEKSDLQQKRFGPNGDFINQKKTLAKPVQDQVFTAIQDIAEAKRYDFVFDKASDLTILYAAKRFDISDQVLRVINRSEKRQQLNKKELEEQIEKENKEDAIAENPERSEREKILLERKAARDKILEDRKLEFAKKKKEFEENREKVLTEREAKKNGTVSENTTKETSTAVKTIEAKKQEQTNAREKALEERKKILEERRKLLEERRAKLIRTNDSIMKARK